MKKLLLASALALAAWPAHAINVATWQCSRGRQVTYEVNKSIRAKDGSAGYDFTVSGIRSGQPPRVRFRDDGVYLNGRRCEPCHYGDCSKEGLQREREWEQRKCVNGRNCMAPHRNPDGTITWEKVTD